jgi:epoxyqueuosine reductase
VLKAMRKQDLPHTSQEVCPWNEKFSVAFREEAFKARPAVDGKDAVTLAHELLAMSDEEFRTAFKGSPMKRAKLSGLKRNATVVLGNSELPPHTVGCPPR